MNISYDELGTFDFEEAAKRIGLSYRLALDGVSGRLVRVLRNEPLPPRCFKVLMVTALGPFNQRMGANSPYRRDGTLAPYYWSLPRWHEQKHARELILRGDPASTDAGRGRTTPQ